jgi:hypothetical protein
MPEKGKAKPTKASWSSVDPTVTSSDSNAFASDNPLNSDYATTQTPEYMDAEANFANAETLGADESEFAAGAGGEGAAGGAGLMGLLAGGGGGGPRAAATGNPNLAAPAMYFDPNPSAAENIAVGNRALGHIDFSKLFRGAKPNAQYDPLAGPSSTNLPYEPTTGFTGGLKRFFLGNRANELNASAMDQAQQARAAVQARQFATDEAIRQGVQTHLGTTNVDINAIPQKSNAELLAEANRLGLSLPATQGLNKRGVVSPLERTEAETRKDIGAAENADLLLPGQITAQGDTSAATRAGITKTDAEVAALRQKLATDKELDPLIVAKNRLANELTGKTMQYDIERARQAVQNPHVTDKMIVTPRGVVLDKEDPLAAAAAGRQPGYKAVYAPPVDMSGNDSTIGGMSPRDAMLNGGADITPPVTGARPAERSAPAPAAQEIEPLVLNGAVFPMRPIPNPTTTAPINPYAEPAPLIDPAVVSEFVRQYYGNTLSPRKKSVADMFAPAPYKR